MLKRKGRTALTVLAVCISVSLLISMTSISEGMYASMANVINNSKEDILITTYDIENGILDNGIEDGHALSDELMFSGNFSSASPFAIGGLLAYGEKATSGNGSSNVVIGIGMVPNLAKQFLDDDKVLAFYDMEIRFRGWFTTPDDPHYGGGYTGPWTSEVLIDDIFSSRYDAGVGDRINLTIGPRNQSVMFTVVGTFSMGMTATGLISEVIGGVVVLHLSELQSLIGDDVFEQGNNVTVKDKVIGISLSMAKGHKDPGSVRSNARSLSDRFPYYKVMTKEDRMDLIERNIILARIFYVTVASVSLVIGLLFVCAIMYISVHERTKEIGVLRAIGISRRTIFLDVMLESMLIVIAGSLIGIIPGIFGSRLINEYLNMIYGYTGQITLVTPELLLYTQALVIAVGLVISLFPAIRAVNINIVKAIRGE